MQPDRLAPVEDDRDTAGFWAAARRRELAVRFCDGCGQPVHVPMARCPRCGSWDGEWRTMTGRGRLYSWTTVEHQVHPAYPVPYTVVLVELEEAPSVRLVGRLAGAPQLTAGQEMEVWFEELEGGAVLPQWRPL